MKTIIKRIHCFLPVLFAIILSLQASGQQAAFNKAVFYKVMQNGDEDMVDKMLTLIQSTPGINKQAYSGALLMKKAGLVKGPANKLSAFKEGHSKLEEAIEKENSNAEWHLLRLIIQEHAPRLLNYHGDINNDAAIVHNAYKKLSPEVQSAVMDYRKHSDTLQPLQF